MMVHRHELWLPYLAFCFDLSGCFWDLHVWSGTMGNKSGKLWYVLWIMTNMRSVRSWTPNWTDTVGWCKWHNSELGAQTALHFSVSRGVIQRENEAQQSATSSLQPCAQ